MRYGRDKWGKPLWECPPLSAENLENVRNAVGTYLGRLVPMSRGICLDANGINVILANGLDYSKQDFREPHSTIVLNGKTKERNVLGGSTDKAVWRELHSLTVLDLGEDSTGGPLTLVNAPDNTPFDLWVGGVVYDRSNVAKLLESMESVFHVPASMLHDPGQRCYADGVEYARDGHRALQRAIAVYREALGGQAVDTPVSAFAYWTRVEIGLPALLTVVADPTLLTTDGWRRTPWGRSIQEAGRQTYDLSCPRGTTRQMRAYALGYNELMNPRKPRRGKTGGTVS